MSGSMNWAIVLLFNDGLEWIFRSPMSDNGLSRELYEELLESEVATMKYVKSNSTIPVPEVFDHW